MSKTIRLIQRFLFLAILIIFYHSSIAQTVQFEASKIKQIKNYKSFQLENGLTVLLLNNGDSSKYFIRYFTNLPQYVDKINRPALAVDTEIRKLKGFELPEKFDKQYLKELKIEIDKDINGFYANCNSGSIDSALSCFLYLFQKPIISGGTIDKAKRNILSESDSISKMPEDKIDKITKSIIYGKDHPILKFFNATEINSVSKEIYLDFYSRFYKTNNSYLVVIGAIAEDSLKAIVNKHFGLLKKKEIASAGYKLIPIEEPKIVFFDTIPLGQTTIKILFPFALQPFTFDSEKAELISVLFQKILSDRLVDTMKLAKNIEARFESDKITGNYQLSVGLEKDSLNLVVQTIIQTISDLKAGKYKAEDLSIAKSKIIADYKNHNTDNPYISWLLINTERTNLGKEYYADFIESVNAIDKPGIQTFAAKYLNYNTALFQIPGRWYQSLNEFIRLSKDFRIELYKLDGTVNKVIPKGFNGFSVIDNYIKAVGGVDNIQKIKDVVIKYGAIYDLSSGQQMFIEGRMVHKAENKYYSNSKMIRPQVDTTFLNIEIFDGSQGIDSTMQGRKTLLGADLELLKYKSPFVPEMKYKEWNFQAKLVLADTLNGNYVWMVVLENPAKQKIIDYYDVDKGLRYKRIVTDNAYFNERTIIYSKYQKNEENEILYPNLKVINTKEATIRILIREIDYKIKINKKIFEIF